MSEFFYRSGPNEYGPLTSNELRKLADAGRLAATVQVRKGRSGKWMAAGKVPGLFPHLAMHDEPAINEMDVIADVPAPGYFDQSAEPSQRDTAVDSEAKGSESRSVHSAHVPRRKEDAQGNDSALRQRATVVAGICYFSSLFGAVLGTIRLFGDQTLLHHVFIGICFLFALIGLAGGCGISLLLARRR
jgi:hypothetical protein